MITRSGEDDRGPDPAEIDAPTQARGLVMLASEAGSEAGACTDDSCATGVE